MGTFTVHVINVKILPYARIVEKTTVSGGGKMRGLRPRNDVLTTCKAVTKRGGQRIITVLVGTSCMGTYIVPLLPN